MCIYSVEDKKKCVSISYLAEYERKNHHIPVPPTNADCCRPPVYMLKACQPLK